MRKTCNVCNQKKWFVSRRQYTVKFTPETNPIVITSNGILCRKCYKKLKKGLNIK